MGAIDSRKIFNASPDVDFHCVLSEGPDEGFHQPEGSQVMLHVASDLVDTFSSRHPERLDLTDVYEPYLYIYIYVSTTRYLSYYLGRLFR